MSLITVLIAIVIVLLILYLIGLIPLDPRLRTVAYIVVALILILWLARTAGFV